MKAAFAQATTTTAGHSGVGKPPPPVLGKTSVGSMPNTGGKSAPLYFNVAGVANHLTSPPPPATVPPSMVKTEGK
eukprot:12886635-Prorocentrum_lima.AAC.1